MFTEGNIIYFNPFFFNEGGSKPKYFLVLVAMETNTILASLPSSQPHLPADIPIVHGCISQPDCGISCYIFNKAKPITTNGWSFEKDTFLHGHWISDYEIGVLHEKYQVEGVEYEIIGQLTIDELACVKECFKNSPVVKRKYRRYL